MLNYEPEGSLRDAAQKYMNTTKAQPAQEAITKEEIKEPEEELIETEEGEELEVDSDDNTDEDAEDDSDGEDESEEEESQLIKLKVDGVIHELPLEKVTELAQMGMDYTKKTQALSDKVKTEAKRLADEKTVDLEKRRTDLIEATDLMEQFYNQPIATREALDKLLDEGDYESHSRLKDQEERRQELVRQVKEQRKQAQEEAQREHQAKLEKVKQEQIEIVLTKLPELKDKAEQDKLEGFLKSFGYKDEEIGSFVYNANNILLADAARKYHELTKTGVKVKPKSKAPNVTKKAGNKATKLTKTDRRKQELSSQLKQSGKTKDAVELYKQMFLKK